MNPVFAYHAPTPAERLKDAGAAAFVALLVGVPMIGLTTGDVGGALQIATRWPALAAFIAACFAGRFMLRYTVDRLKARKHAKHVAKGKTAQTAATGKRLLPALGWLLLGASVMLPVAFQPSSAKPPVAAISSPAALTPWKMPPRTSSTFSPVQSSPRIQTRSETSGAAKSTPTEEEE